MIVDGRDWTVLGAGMTLDDAIEDARDGERDPDEEPCPHCRRYPSEPDETYWRAYSLTARAYDLLTCGGPFRHAFQQEDFRWSDTHHAFTAIPDAWCIACRSDGVLPRKHLKPGSPAQTCTVCLGEGSFPPQGIEWIAPPASAAIWRGKKKT